MFVGSINSISFPFGLERIEFGALLPESGLMTKQVCFRDANWVSECDEMPPDGEHFFIYGDCQKLNKVWCKLCYMHQYGLNNIQDGLDEMCENPPKQNKIGKLAKCFWNILGPKATLPKEVGQDNSLLDSIYNEYESVKVCPDLNPITTRQTVSPKPSGSEAISTMEPVWQPDNYVRLNRTEEHIDKDAVAKLNYSEFSQVLLISFLAKEFY